MTETMTVAVKDGFYGCPKIRWHRGYSFRCGLGRIECELHGPFATTQIPTPSSSPQSSKGAN